MNIRAIAVLLSGATTLIANAADNPGAGHNMPGTVQVMQNGQSGAIGKPGDPAKVGRTVEMVMNDSMRFVPDQIVVKKGETIRFFVKNTGKLKHDMVIGSGKELHEHAGMMQNMQHMEHMRANGATLNPGQRGGFVWQFDQPGTVDVACLQPGHMASGMKARIIVE